MEICVVVVWRNVWRVTGTRMCQRSVTHAVDDERAVECRDDDDKTLSGISSSGVFLSGARAAVEHKLARAKVACEKNEITRILCNCTWSGVVRRLTKKVCTAALATTRNRTQKIRHNFHISNVPQRENGKWSRPATHDIRSHKTNEIMDKTSSKMRISFRFGCRCVFEICSIW